jgi:alcohol dehydrogenase class IV
LKILSEIGGISKLSVFADVYKGKKILLVTGKKSYLKSGAKKIVSDSLINEKVIQFSQFSLNPNLKDAISGARIAYKHKTEVIIAIGGGSVIDMAKLIKAFCKNISEAEKITKENRSFNDPNIPIIAIPTTAGSGSEATHFAVIYIDDRKFSVAHQCLLPQCTILDGALLISGSLYQRKCSALDALAQAIESAWAISSNIESRKLAFKSMSVCWNVIKKFSSGKKDFEYQEMIRASNLAGQSINITKTTAPHAFSYNITKHYNIPHGHAIWLTLPAILQIHFNACQKDILDPRGIIYFKEIMLKIIKILNLDIKYSLEEQLKKIVEDMDVKLNFDDLGIDTVNKRKEICKNVNIERLSNNPVNLNDMLGYIFKY